jgi:predicted transcriptional regulator
VSTVQRSRAELVGASIADVVTGRGKELALDDTVVSARRLFENASVQVIPVLDGVNYVGAVDRGAVHSGISDRTPIEALVQDILPTCRAGTPVLVALAALDESGANRLVVLDDDANYLGLVCLRSDRQRLCVDAECHVQPSSPGEGDT